MPRTRERCVAWNVNTMASAQRKDGRIAIKIYQTFTYLGWIIRNPPNLGASSG
jgi:hypothetical protein